MPIKNRIAELHDEITAWRRDFHAHPELMYDTERTSRIVAEKLRAFGCDEVVEGIGRTGVVGVIKGKSNSSDRVIGLRADMDALPISEATGAEYASTVPGKMHACGHDGHTAMLLGAAKYLSETRNFDGTAVVVFQPAEEGGAGGDAMVKDGLIERFGIQEIYGMHNMPGLPVGRFSIKAGPFYAATDEFTITIRGVGGHAARPQVTVDPTVAGAHMVLALQTIVARNADPFKAIVLTVTSFLTDSDSYNVIPASVVLKGTIRTFDEQVRELAEQRLRAIAASSAETFGAKAELQWERGYPPMVNHDRETEHARQVAQNIAGEPTGEANAIMGAEDFAYMLEACAGAYIQLGNGDTANVHHPEYDFNDEAIPHGTSYWAELVETRMPAR